MDDEEPWGPHGRNLEWVAAHEIGHALGLPHSDPKQPSIMLAQYDGYRQSHPHLYQSDIISIQRLYGEKNSLRGGVADI